MNKLHCFVLFFIFCVHIYFASGTECNPHSIRAQICGANQTCSALGKCECIPGFKLHNSTCLSELSEKSPGALPVTDNSTKSTDNSSHVAAGIFIPLTLIIVVIAGVFLVRKYKLYSWVRNKINQRSSNYDEVMIGQVLDDDDPPLH